jgi:hypothetical protein
VISPRGICRLELDHFDKLLVCHELHEIVSVYAGVDACTGLVMPVGTNPSRRV